MQEKVKGIAACPNCGKVIEVIVWNRININKYPHLKASILNGRFFENRCPECQKVFRTAFPFFYYDTVKKVLIRFLPEEQKDNVSIPLSTSELADYRFRLVSESNEFIEKINLFEYDFHDKVLELCKAAVLPRVKKAFPDTAIEKLHTVIPNCDMDELNFEVISGDSVLSTISISMKAYKDTFSAVSPYLEKELSDGTFIKVDHNWIYSEEGRKVRNLLKEAVRN